MINGEEVVELCAYWLFMPWGRGGLSGQALMALPTIETLGDEQGLLNQEGPSLKFVVPLHSVDQGGRGACQNRFFLVKAF